MYIKKEEIELASLLLAKDCPQLSEFLKDTCKTESIYFCYEILNRNDYWASILWNDADIAEALADDDIPATQENIDIVKKDAYMIDAMENCEYGWEILHARIDVLKQNGELK